MFKQKSVKSLKFVDAFAGCGGLSLGLLQAGLEGCFAIERDSFAFETLSKNLLRPDNPLRFSWPTWLPKKPVEISEFLKEYSSQLSSLSGEIDLLVGGPPCQGFSSAGRRQHNDPRNKLFSAYLELVDLLKPKVVLIENVRGFTVDFSTESRTLNYSQKLKNRLAASYKVYERLIDVSCFGVPQQRTRYFLLAIKSEYVTRDPFAVLMDRIPGFLRARGLRAPVASRSALSDLEVTRCGVRPSTETPGYSEIAYQRPLTAYQKLMHADCDRVKDVRLARHAEEISGRFAEIIEMSHAEGRLNTAISAEMRSKYGLKKRAIRVLDPDKASPTITSMPDDLLHYREPRTLTVRENARLQSFPDWYAFRGKYTTGGHLRRIEVPRFTQVANAVPPLVAQALGEMIKALLAPQLDLQSPNRIEKRSKVAA